MNDWAYILRPIPTRQLVNPHASMEVPVADLKRALGAKAPTEGILLTYTGRSSYNSKRRQCLSKLDTLHHLVRLEYVPLYPHSVLYLILFLLPPLPLMLPHSALIVIGVLLLMSGPPPPLLLYCLPAPSR